MLGKSPIDICCVRDMVSYTLDKLLISSFFLASLPTIVGISFFKCEIT
ncbi:unnamed protein product [Schistosoma curassoni]|uniref:Uncharacterized protein n=1 Tax=Schistosoma curassoni TaxID=6186 RepID=A0A183KX47_9TREM|nr:unnamed protein product [Schistosoma curassoni]